MASFVEKIIGRNDSDDDRRRDARDEHYRHHKHHKDRHREASAKIIRVDETPAQTVPQLERKIMTLRDHLEHDLGEKDALLKLIIAGIQNLQDGLDVEKNERCDDADELHNLCNKLRLALDQEADARYGVDQSLEAFKEHSDYADLELKADIEQLQDFERDTNEDKKIIMGAIMELEEKLNEVRSTHGHQIDDLLINQGQIRKSIEEQIQIIHRIQLSDFENATLKITEIQNKLQEQILTQAQDFRDLTIEANNSMGRQRKQMDVIKRHVEDRIEELGVTVNKKETGLQLKLDETKERFDKIEAHFEEITSKFTGVNAQVETAIDQIHSTRAKAEEATDGQKNRFDYFDMFMQSLKQSQATIDSRVGFLYTIVNELRWRERVETQRSSTAARTTRQHSSSNMAAVGDLQSQKSTRSAVSYTSEAVDLDNVTQTINDIEIEMKARLEVVADNLEQHRKDTLQAISMARDKTLTSTIAVDKFQTVVDRMHEKFGDIARVEGDIAQLKKRFDHTDKKVDHLEGISETASKKVDVLTRKMWDMFDSEMNLNMFIDNHLQDDKERLWRLEYDHNHLKHMTIGEGVSDEALPLHLQSATSVSDVDTVKKNISRCLVKSEQLVDDVTNIAKQNDMIRNDMRDLKLLCDYLSSKNDETQRYCRALRKHLDYTNKKLEAYECGKRRPFNFLGRCDDDLYDDDLPPLRDTKRPAHSSPKPTTPILNLFMRNKERRSNTPNTVDKVEAIPLKSTRGATPPPPSAPPPPPPYKSAQPGPSLERQAADPTLTPSRTSSTSGFLSNFFEKKEDEEVVVETSKKDKGFLERIFGSKGATPSPPPKDMGHLRRRGVVGPQPPPKNTPDDRPKHESVGHINIPTSNVHIREEFEAKESHKEHFEATKIDIERGVLAEDQVRREKESAEKLRIQREREMVDREQVERLIAREQAEKERRRKEDSLRAKQDREKRLVDATERARYARANEKVIKGELPTKESWEEEQRLRQLSYERRKKYQDDQDRMKREQIVRGAQEARERMEMEERIRRERESLERLEALHHETERPRHLSDEHHEVFGEVSPNTAHEQKHDTSHSSSTHHSSFSHSSSSSSQYESSEEEETSETTHSPPHAVAETPEDPWSFDIESQSLASRSSRQESQRNRKKKSVFKR